MAYDKVIDSSALDANLASIAEAIRTKGGTTDQLVFPAGFISAIEAIEAGGGGGFDSIQTVSGSFTPDSLITAGSQEYPNISAAFTVEHNARFIPRAAVAYTGKIATSTLTLYVAIMAGYANSFKIAKTFSIHQYYSSQRIITNSRIRTNDDTWGENNFVIATGDSDIQLAAGTKVNWIVFS